MEAEHIKLLSAAAQGDQAAFAKLYQCTAGRLYAASLQLLQRRDLAEEAMQEAYVRIWYSAADYQQDKGSVQTWMISIVRYRALDMLRYAKRRREDGDQEHEAETADSPETNLYQQRERTRIDECMDHLGTEQRQAIQLAYFKGFTHREVCGSLGLPLGSVKSWIRRGLQGLKRCLEI